MPSITALIVAITMFVMFALIVFLIAMLRTREETDRLAAEFDKDRVNQLRNERADLNVKLMQQAERFHELNEKYVALRHHEAASVIQLRNYESRLAQLAAAFDAKLAAIITEYEGKIATLETAEAMRKF